MIARVRRQAAAVVRRFPMTRHVTLAIDDGPSDATEALLDHLERAGHRAVLFVLGSMVDQRRRDILMDAIRRGFALGNHSFSHPRFSEIELSQARQEIGRTETTIEDIYRGAGTRRPGKWFRFPYMDTGEQQAAELRRLLREFGFERPGAIATWTRVEDPGRLDWPTTLCTRDWELPAESMIRATLKAARPGDVVEFHDKVETVSRYGRALSEELSKPGIHVRVPATRESRQ